MKLAAFFITACVVLAAAQAVAAALAIAVLLALICGLLTQPRETVGMIALAAALTAFGQYPLPCIGLLVLLTLAKIVRRQ